MTASLDTPEKSIGASAGTNCCIVACPPHPQSGGRRSDRRLRAVADAAVDREIACLRFDYGPWDGGVGERSDAHDALDWASDRYERVGIFGYSFGGGIAILAAAGRTDVSAVSALAPASRVAENLDAAAALADVDSPVQIIYGERDETVDWQPIADRAQELGHAVESFGADHYFVGQQKRVGRLVADFFETSVRPRNQGGAPPR